MALQGWSTLSLCLRRRARALVFATAWVPGNSCGGIRHSCNSGFVQHPQEMQPHLHRYLCATGEHVGCVEASVTPVLAALRD
jgi:hypothetical protein